MIIMKSKGSVDVFIAIVVLVGLLVIAELGDDFSGMISHEDETSSESSSSSTSSSTTSSTSLESSSSSSTSSTSSSSSTSSTSSSSSTTSSSSTSSTSTTSTTLELGFFEGKNYRRKPSSEAQNSGIGSKKTVFSSGQKISSQVSRGGSNNISGNIIGVMKNNIGVSVILILVILVLIIFILKNYNFKSMFLIFSLLGMFLFVVSYLSLSGNITLESVSNYSYYEIDNIVIGESLINQEITDNDLDGLQDRKVNFRGDDINIHDEITLGRITSPTNLNNSDGVSIESSLSAKDYGYGEELGMEVTSGVLSYHYIFDESVDLSKASSSNSLDISFLGKSLNIIEILSNNEFKVRIGNENFMNIGDSVNVNGKKVELKNVGDDGSVLVEVDGSSGIVDVTKDEIINDVQISVGSTFYSYDTSERSAMLRIGEKTVGVYQDNNPFIGENDTNPDWLWDIGELKTVSSGDRYSSGGGPTIGIKNDFILDDDKNSVKVGECVKMGNTFGYVCFDSVTKTSPVEYLIHYAESCELEAKSNQKCLVIETSLENGLAVKTGTSFETKKILLSFNETIGKIDVYYKDSSNEIKLSNTITTASDVLIGAINYKKTSERDMEFHLLGTSNTANNMELDIQVNGEGRASSGRDDLHIPLSHSTTDFSGIRGIEWGSDNLDLKTVDEHVKGLYGYSVKDPKQALIDNKVRLNIPETQVKAIVSVRGNELI